MDLPQISPGDVGIALEAETMDKLARRWGQAIASLRSTVDADPGRRSGIPCLKGTRVTLAQILAQVAEGESIDELCNDLSLDRSLVSEFIHSLAIILDRKPA